ncbi:MAG: 2-dehydropantoate 2-reductase [Caldilineales bacterium]|nr:2-dehydropantoate 2-reductase [Caldilineales bacterium]MDW8316677.1 2-dehydropantoate 2-reductase [Anaerolineae bacterium]
MTQPYLVVGAGAIGTFVAASMALSGQPVILVARGDAGERIRQAGLQLRTAHGETLACRVAVAPSTAAALAGSPAIGLAILAVKSYDTAQAMAELRAATASPPPVLTLQNGVGNEETAVAALPNSHVLAGAITTPVSVEAPGAVVVERDSRRLGLADVQLPADPAAGRASLAAVAAAFQRAGFQVRCYDDWRSLKWTKLVMNLLCNASCALLGWTPEQVWDHPGLVRLEMAAWREAMAVVRGLGLRLINLGGYPLAPVEPLLRRLPVGMLAPALRPFVVGGRGDKLPSLYLDLSRGKGRSEVAWLNGAVVEAGRQLGLATPANRALTDALLAVVRGDEAWSAYRDQPAALLARWRAAE